MSKPYTHILETYPESVDRQGNKRPSQAMLYRASDGMTIAARQHTVVSLGADKNEAIIRTYRDERYATAALRKFADDDQRQSNHNSAGALIEEVDMSHTIMQPSLGDITSISNGRRQ